MQITISLYLGAAVTLALSLPAHAADSAARASGHIPSATKVLLPRTTNGDAADASDGSAPLSEAALASYRGGQTIVPGSQTLTAITNGNVLTGDYAAGDITLSGNSLSNFSGVGNFAINTGAQVSLQSGMNLTINVGQ